jgi:hypothetical protein
LLNGDTLNSTSNMNHLSAMMEFSLALRGKLSEVGSPAPSLAYLAMKSQGKPRVLRVKAHNIKSCSRPRVAYEQTVDGYFGHTKVHLSHPP